MCVNLPWGVLFATLWLGSQYFAYIAIAEIGYAVGPAIWGGLTIVVSFAWGIAFGEQVKSPLGAAAALFLLVGKCELDEL